MPSEIKSITKRQRPLVYESTERGCLRVLKIMETESRMVGAGSQRGWVTGSYCSMGTEFQSGKMKGGMEIDGGEGCIS